MMRVANLRCIRCGTLQPMARVVDGCPQCRDARTNLQAVYAVDPGARWRGGVPALPASAPLGRLGAPLGRASMWRYDRMLPFAADEAISLGEGGTPLIEARTLGIQLGLDRLLIKDESRNPTWSYKDRLSTVAVSAARQLGAAVVATSSSGNAGASLAAYAARAGLPCVVLTFAGTAGPMLSQIEKYGAMVVPLARKQDRWPALARGVRNHGWFATSPFGAPVVGSHPLGIEGYKTLAYEICEDLGGQAPDWVVMPVCYGDAFAGAWYGFEELHRAGVIPRLPRMVAAEVFGSLRSAMATGLDTVPDMPATFAHLAVSVGATQGAFQALNALRRSDGHAVAVGNDGLIAMQERLAATEGLFAELSSVMPLQAAQELRRTGVIKQQQTVVCVATASGLKDLDRSVPSAAPQAAVKGDAASIERFLAERYGFGASSAATAR